MKPLLSALALRMKDITNEKSPLRRIQCAIGGIFLKEYPIRDNEKEVGRAQVRLEGRFLHIRCDCPLLSLPPKRLAVTWKGGIFHLGLCVPEKGVLTLVKRVSKQSLPEDEMAFVVYHGEETGVQPEQEHAPVDILRLQNARLEIVDGAPVIVYGQPSSKPTGQWSEPRISE